MTEFVDGFSEEIWRTTYKDHGDQTVDDTLRRVAKAIASAEKTPEKRAEWEDKFYDLLSNFKALPGGRILSNAGTGWKATTFANCFVGPVPTSNVDSIEGIYKMLTDQAQTLKSEGGWGHNFSMLRPRGSFIEGVGVESPGAVKFMELFDRSSDIVTAGSGRKSTNVKAKGKIRKGAMMGVLNCFEKNTQVVTNRGLLTIQEICENKEDNVYAITEDGEEHKIIDWFITPPSMLYEVEDELGNKVSVTADQKFQVRNIETGEEYLKPILEIDSEKEYLIRMEP